MWAQVQADLAAAGMAADPVDVLQLRGRTDAFHLAKFPDAGTPAEKVQALVGRKIGITGPGSGTEALVNPGSAAASAIEVRAGGRAGVLPADRAAGGGGPPARGDVPSLKGALHGCVCSTRKLLDGRRPSSRRSSGRWPMCTGSRAGVAGESTDGATPDVREASYDTAR
ncbi:hypothetical protein [Amycolatopsis thermophila]|uniref:Uncharacterized protein n=1 Tax=Amycolatopsis thermophila TaxID=206084 RepID=A0ABU0ERW8_9PSEU|nr:hypothetical protein [Amycolatopsis thermophila]MDQ0378034.1 hypothetical protein [Amycolatopsis thermophila]